MRTTYRRSLLAAAAALPLAGATAAPAPADEQIVAEEIARFAPPEVTIDAGEPLRFVNRDVSAFIGHDVTALANGANGQPLFATPTIFADQTAPVAGAERLNGGTYAFYCTIHPWMRGELTVRARQPDAGPGRDAMPPVLRARLRAAKLRTVVRRRRLRAVLRVDEPVKAAVNARARGVTLARRRVALRTGRKRVTLRLTSAGRRALRGRKRVRVTLRVRARDAAGNRARARARATLR